MRYNSVITREFDNVLALARTVDEVEVAVLTLLKEKRRVQASKLGFVSGTLFSDGPEFVQRNIRRLAHYTSALRLKYSFPLFSGYDVLYNGRMDRLPESKLPYLERRTRMLAFWKTIITCGSITDMFMMPGWERSEGARDEHRSAREMGMTVHYSQRGDLCLRR